MPENSPPAAPAKNVIRYTSLDDGIAQLPSYSRSLLKVSLQVSVKLAQCKLKVNRVLELAHGSVIQFDKSYDEPLELEVGGQVIALGEAVKVGESFGLRITSIKLPDERFHALENPAKAAS